MIGWLQPAALWGLLLVAGPVIVHLFQRRRAKRVPFPSLQFVRASKTAAIRLQPPSAWVVLLVRMAVVALAVCAVAQPLVMTSRRLHAWDAQVARAVILDVSASMRVPDANGRTAAEQAIGIAEAESQGSTMTRTFDSEQIGDGLVRAVAWLRTTPPARREIVLMSDMQQDTISSGHIEAVPAAVGIRFIQVGHRVSPRAAPGLHLLGAEGVPSRAHEVELSTSGTRVTLSVGAAHAGGLRLITEPEQTDARARLLRTVAVAGAPAPDTGQPIAVRFAADQSPADSVAPIQDTWMLRAVLRLRQDETIQRLAEREAGEAFTETAPWAVVARNASGRPLVRAASVGAELLVDVASPPPALFAAAVLRGVLAAREGPVEKPEAEVLTITPERLSAWSRPPAPLEQDAWRRARTSDARWFWLAALLLLGLEHVLRERTGRAIQREDGRAAA